MRNLNLAASLRLPLITSARLDHESVRLSSQSPIRCWLRAVPEAVAVR
jgi:hypothetical protein